MYLYRIVLSYLATDLIEEVYAVGEDTTAVTDKAKSYAPEALVTHLELVAGTDCARFATLLDSQVAKPADPVTATDSVGCQGSGS